MQASASQTTLRKPTSPVRMIQPPADSAWHWRAQQQQPAPAAAGAPPQQQQQGSIIGTSGVLPSLTSLARQFENTTQQQP